MDKITIVAARLLHATVGGEICIFKSKQRKGRTGRSNNLWWPSDPLACGHKNCPRLYSSEFGRNSKSAKDKKNKRVRVDQCVQVQLRRFPSTTLTLRRRGGRFALAGWGWPPGYHVIWRPTALPQLAFMLCLHCRPTG